MAWVESHWNNGLSLKPHQTDLNCFRAVKSRQPTACSKCKKPIPKGSHLYGSDWIRLCLGCGDKFSDEAIVGFQGVIDYIKSNQAILKENKDKWEADNTLALL